MVREKDNNFKEKTRKIFLKYALIPVLILLLLFPMFLLIAERIRVVNNADEASSRVGELIEEAYNSYFAEIEGFSKSELVIDFIDNGRSSNLIYEEFYNFNNKQQVKSIFHILDKEGNFLASSVNPDYFVKDKIITDIVPRIMKKPGNTLTETNMLRYPRGQATVYSFGRAVFKDSRIVGYVLYQLYEKDLQELIFVQNVEVTVVTDQYDRIIASTSNIVRGLMDKFSPIHIKPNNYVLVNDGRYYMGRKALSVTPIFVYTLISTQFNSAVFLLYFIFVFTVGLILWFVMHYLADKISSENTRSIDKLLYAVYELQEGNLDSYVKIDSGDEFEVLAGQYNIMLDRLKELIRKNEELSNIRRIKEIKLLQAQFNPHFMFNILETLRYTIAMNQEQAFDIIITLSRLLQYSIREEKQDVVFKKDLAYIKDYLKLHKIRFKERLTYNIDVPKEVENALVPKLLLQSIIENSIKYGYRNKKSLHIDVTSQIVEGKLIFKVTDNGEGITEEKLNLIRRINQQSNADIDSSRAGVQQFGGLYNVHRRLVLLYGEEYGLAIESEQDAGTLVRITLPYRKERDDV